MGTWCHRGRQWQVPSPTQEQCGILASFSSPHCQQGWGFGIPCTPRWVCTCARHGWGGTAAPQGLSQPAPAISKGQVVQQSCHLPKPDCTSQKLISELQSAHNTPSQIFLPKNPISQDRRCTSEPSMVRGGNCGEGLRLWGTHTRAGTAQRRQKGGRKVCCKEWCEIRHRQYFQCASTFSATCSSAKIAGPRNGSIAHHHTEWSWNHVWEESKVQVMHIYFICFNKLHHNCVAPKGGKSTVL